MESVNQLDELETKTDDESVKATEVKFGGEPEHKETSVQPENFFFDFESTVSISNLIFTILKFLLFNLN